MWYKQFPYKEQLVQSKYAQTSEEQIIKHIADNIELKNKMFVDIGCGNGKYLSNTALLREQGWKGMGIDANTHGVEGLTEQFITKDNIVQLLKSKRTRKEFDLLSIDIDGNDYWILKEILTAYKPNIIIAELNPIFAGEAKVMAYNKSHTWQGDDYYGASFAAFRKLLEQEYTLVYNLHELNLFFVKSEIIGGFQDLGISHVETNYHKPSPFAKSDSSKWIDV